MGQSETVHHLDFIIGLFAMMDPLAAIPMLLAVTAGFTGTQRRLTVLMALVGMLVILLGAQYSGVLLLETLGTSLASFQIAGGLVIAWSGFSMLRAVQEEPDRPTDVRRASPFELGIVPLAIPLLAGPGAITKVLLEAQDGFGLDSSFHISLNIVIACTAAALVLLLAGVIGRLVGAVGLIIFNRVFGLVVVAIGVEIVVGGVGAHLAAFRAAAGS
jgi:multiple antibiotic resistance protein